MHKVSDEIMKQIKGASFEEGVRYALEELASLYDGISETDLWADYMNGDNN